jgi:hypothetical protein
MTLVNKESCSRSLVVFNGLLAFVLSYNKTNSNLQADKTVFRYLPSVVGNLVVKMFVLIRPVQIIFSTLIGNKRVEDLQTFVACYSLTGKVMDSENYRRIFTQAFDSRG